MIAIKVFPMKLLMIVAVSSVLAMIPGQSSVAQTNIGSVPGSQAALPEVVWPARPSPESPGLPESSATLTLQDFIDAAAKNGDEILIVESNLAAARAQYNLIAGKDAPSLSAAGLYGMNGGIGSDLTKAPAASTLRSALGSAYPGISQSFQGSLSLVQGTQSTTNPNTRLGLTLTQNFPYQLSTSPFASTILGLSASQSIWDGYPGGQTRAAVEKGIIALRGKELSADMSKALLVLNLKKAYVTMLSAQRILATRFGILDKQNSLLKQITAIYNLRQASLVDFQNATINAKTASLDVETAKHDLSLARQRLANLAGMPPDSDFSVAEIPEPALPAATLEEAIAAGLQKRPELGLSDLNRKSTSIDLDLAKGQSSATFSVTGGINMAVVWSATAATAGSASLLLKVGLPIVDAGAANALSESSLSLIGVYDAQKRQLAKSIAADIRDTWWMVEIQSERIILAKQSVDLYSTKLAIVKAQNSFGTASLQDLLSASVDSANAEAAYATAKSNYLLAVLALEVAMGL